MDALALVKVRPRSASAWPWASRGRATRSTLSLAWRVTAGGSRVRAATGASERMGTSAELQAAASIATARRIPSRIVAGIISYLASPRNALNTRRRNTEAPTTGLPVGAPTRGPETRFRSPCRTLRPFALSSTAGR